MKQILKYAIVAAVGYYIGFNEMKINLAKVVLETQCKNKSENEETEEES